MNIPWQGRTVEEINNFKFRNWNLQSAKSVLSKEFNEWVSSPPRSSCLSAIGKRIHDDRERERDWLDTFLSSALTETSLSSSWNSSSLLDLVFFLQGDKSPADLESLFIRPGMVLCICGPREVALNDHSRLAVSGSLGPRTSRTLSQYKLWYLKQDW